MTEAEDLQTRIDGLRTQLREVHGIRGRSPADALKRARRVLPRQVRREAQQLVAALPMLGHPKLERQLDFDDLRAAEQEVSRHLKSVDVADLRRGRLLGIAAAIAFNLLVVLIAFLIWAVQTGHL